VPCPKLNESDYLNLVNQVERFKKEKANYQLANVATAFICFKGFDNFA
jgi:hypothetical protein